LTRSPARIAHHLLDARMGPSSLVQSVPAGWTQAEDD
jgi:hypothetical protein